MKIIKRMKQCGFIVWSSGMNKKAWLHQARQDGYYVRRKKGYAELWRQVVNDGDIIGVSLNENSMHKQASV